MSEFAQGGLVEGPPMPAFYFPGEVIIKRDTAGEFAAAWLVELADDAGDES